MSKPALLLPISMALAVVLALFAALSPVGAQAPETPRLAGPVTDLADSADVSAPTDGSLERLEFERNYDLFSLFVDSTGDRSIAEYTDDVARLNGLGATDALMVVAIEDRAYQLWLGDTIAERVSEGEQDSLLANEVEPDLAAGRYTDAVSAAANGIRSASGASSGIGISSGFLFLLIVAGAFIGLFVLFQLVVRGTFGRSRRGAPTGANPGGKPVSIGELENQANELLLRVDEGVREAEQELGFAEAELSEAELGEFAEAIKQARARLMHAFELRQELDDATPETEEHTRATLQSVIAECEEARRLLATQFEHVNEQRDFERNAQETLSRLEREVSALERRLPTVERAMAQLRTQADNAWQPVRGNIEEAQKRIAVAHESIADGRDAGDSDRATAARDARIAQQAIGEGRVLLDAVENLGKQLFEARSNLPQQLTEAANSILAARQALNAEGESEEKADAIREQLERARSLAAADLPDLLAAYQLARHADAAADELVASLRTASEETRKAQAAVDLEIDAARSTYRRAADYISARRGSVEREARTRLAEASRLLQSAESLREENPQKALAQARRANDLAEDAMSLARDNFDVHQTWGTGTVFPGGIPGMIILGGLGGIFGGGGFGGGFGGGRRSGGDWGRSMGDILGGGLGGRSRGGRW